MVEIKIPPKIFPVSPSSSEERNETIPKLIITWLINIMQSFTPLKSESKTN